MLVLIMGIAFLGFSRSQIQLNVFNQISIIPLIASPRLASILVNRNIKPIGVFEVLDVSAIRRMVSILLKPYSGIYAVVNLVNGKIYVGSVSQGNFYRRLIDHVMQSAGSRLVAAAVPKYGLSNFAFVILEAFSTETQKTTLLACEDFYISELRPEYNLAVRAGSNLGFKHTQETKERMKIVALMRATMSAETRSRVSANSIVARWFVVSRPDGSQFIGPDGMLVNSVILRTVNVVAAFVMKKQYVVLILQTSYVVVGKLFEFNI